MDFIEAESLIYAYDFSGSKHKALDGVSLHVNKGEMITIVGRNASGKSTFARQLNALLPVQSGTLTVAGINAADKNNIWAVRSSCGMVFQNPDNQFVSTLVEEDLAFGPLNFGMDEKEIPKRITDVLSAVNMSGYEKHSTHLLSGGQKQRIAIAGVLAFKPDIIVFDEVTAMLDPEGRRDVLSVIQDLHCKGHTIIMITHYIEEAVFSDRVVVMDKGRIVTDGAPCNVLTDMELLQNSGLTAPLPVRIYYELAEKGIKLHKCPLTNEELVSALCQLN